MNDYNIYNITDEEDWGYHPTESVSAFLMAFAGPEAVRLKSILDSEGVVKLCYINSLTKQIDLVITKEDI